MTDVLQTQYTLTQHARGILFDFVETLPGDTLNTVMPAFAGKSIRQLLEHTASCYIHWLAYCALEEPYSSLQEEGFTTMPMIRAQYKKVDDLMTLFLATFKGREEVHIQRIHDNMEHLNVTPLELFTHVMTHEFHHKGQIVSICRILGYPPPDTDISNAFQVILPSPRPASSSD